MWRHNDTSQSANVILTQAKNVKTQKRINLELTHLGCLVQCAIRCQHQSRKCQQVHRSNVLHVPILPTASTNGTPLRPSSFFPLPTCSASFVLVLLRYEILRSALFLTGKGLIITIISYNENHRTLANPKLRIDERGSVRHLVHLNSGIQVISFGMQNISVEEFWTGAFLWHVGRGTRPHLIWNLFMFLARSIKEEKRDNFSNVPRLNFNKNFFLHLCACRAACKAVAA